MPSKPDTFAEVVRMLEDEAKGPCSIDRHEKFTRAARRLAVLEEEVEAWRKWERHLWRDLEGVAIPKPRFTVGPMRDLTEARAATDKERANG